MTQSQMPLGPFCQSCGMPLEKPEDFGTMAEGFRQNDYCFHCYQNGAFTNPNITLREMIDLSASFIVAQMGEQQARSLMESTLPHLKRWRGA